MAYANGRLYISEEETNVYSHTMKVEMVKNVSGEEIFQKCQQIAVNKDENSIVVVDVEKKAW